MTDEQIAVAAEAAKERKLEGKWVIALLNTTTQPSLTQLKNRALRERIYRASCDRGWGGEFDTTSEIAQIVKLRAERAALLGYNSHAAYVLEDETALNPARELHAEPARDRLPSRMRSARLPTSRR
jgi:peptidyl-dipeptidase Dcp